VFLPRHADLLKSVDEWTIRVLLPRRIRKAAALYYQSSFAVSRGLNGIKNHTTSPRRRFNVSMHSGARAVKRQNGSRRSPS
jgi:hypothetical protein